MVTKNKLKASRNRRSPYDLNKAKNKHPWEDGFHCGIDKQVRKDLQKAAKDVNERIDNIAKTVGKYIHDQVNIETVEKLEKRIRELEQTMETLREKLRAVTHKVSRTCCF